MANERVNKVVLGNEVLIDITDSTVNPNVLLAGYKAYDSSGNAITGEFSPSYHITLTQAQYDLVSQQEKMADENFFYITDATVVGADIDDTTTSTTKVWSSSKTNTELSAKANSADVPTKAQITNPNLLDNPWFTINQRGQSSYSIPDGDSYTIDRWVAYKGSNGSMTVDTGDSGISITVSSDASDNAFRQRFTKAYSDVLNGKTVTYSIMIGTSIESVTCIVLPQSSNWQGLGSKILSNGITIEVVRAPSTSPFGIEFEIRCPKDGNTYTIRAVKLEIGSISTLALDTAPNYATELLKCQRYFQVFADNNIRAIGVGQATSATSVSIYANIPVKMRTTPSLIFSGVLSLRNGNTNITATATIDIIGESIILFRMITTGATVGACYECYSYNAGVLQLTADL